jgi:outer membrane protein assembly factor BamB
MALSQDGSRAYLGSQAGKFYAIDAATGAKLWEFDTVSNSPLMVAPAVADTGEVYIVDNNGVMYALRDDGNSPTLIWSYETGATSFNYWRGGNSVVLSAPNGMVYTQSRAHALYAVDDSGGLKCKYAAGTRNHIGGLPIDSTGKLHALISSHLVHIGEWTLTAQPLAEYYKAGDTIAITAHSSMLKRDPLANVDNQVQAVLSNGDKVQLVYDSSSGDNSIWKGTYTVPEGTENGSLSVEIQASAYQTVTDIPTNFESLPDGFNNTGMTTTVATKLDRTNPASSSRAVQIAVNGKTYDKYFVPLSIPDLSFVGDNQHPQFCFSKAYDAPNGSGVASYTVRVDGKDYLSNISYNAPPVDGNQTRKDGDHAIIKETDEFWYRYNNYDRPEEPQEICVYGKGDAKKLHPGLHTWSVRVVDNVGNTEETTTRKFLVKVSSGALSPQGAGWGDKPNEEYAPGFSQSEWFPLSILQIGNRSFTNELSTLNPIDVSDKQPVQITSRNLTFYGVAASGSKVTLGVEKHYYNVATDQIEKEEVARRETNTNEASEWGINLTSEDLGLTTSTAEEPELFAATVTVERDDKFAIIRDIPFQIVIRAVASTDTVTPRTSKADSTLEPTFMDGDESPRANPNPSPTVRNPQPMPVEKSRGLWQWFLDLFK